MSFPIRESVRTSPEATLDRERYQKAREIFARAQDLPHDERAGYLDAACGEDAELRAEVAALLQYASRADDLLGEGPGGALRGVAEAGIDDAEKSSTQAPEPSPAELGGYRIVGRLGEGGMATVYEAVQQSPRRRVALKVLRPELLTRTMLRRFEREGGILAHLRHPGIAQIYQAAIAPANHPGVLPQPYLAMELVHGEPITTFAERHALDKRARLALLAKVCDAVEHAHGLGIVHRDLKPANILVTEEGEPKVLDFGVARATDADLTLATLQTTSGHLIGTLAYMSPEQATGDPDRIDARSDVYSLGVIAYELLTGRLPYRVSGVALPEALRRIQESDADRLASRDPSLRGDVETIVAKALDKETGRRYPSAGALAADIRRYLASEPIHARPPSAIYQLRRFAQRNKPLTAALAVAALALVAITALSVQQAVTSRRAERRESELRQLADERAAEAERQQEAALRQAYRANLAAAVAAVTTDDMQEARRHLDAAPEALRGWEWRHLRSRLDESIARIRTPLQSIQDLRFDPASGKPMVVGLRRDTRRPTALVLDERPPSDPTWRELPLFSWAGLDPRLAGMLENLQPEPRSANPEDQAMIELSRSLAGQLDLRACGPRDTASLRGVSPDGAIALFWNLDWSLDLCDLVAGEIVGSFPTEDVVVVAFDPSAGRMAIGGRTRLEMRETRTGRLHWTARGRWTRLLDLAFDPGGSRLVGGSNRGQLVVWDAATGARIGEAAEELGILQSVAIAADGRIAAGDSGGRIHVYSPDLARRTAVLTGSRGPVGQIAFDPGGRILLSSEPGATLRLWDLDAPAWPIVLRGHTLYVYPARLYDNGLRAASAGWDGTIKIWNTRTGELLADRQAPGGAAVLDLEVLADGRLAAITHDFRLLVLAPRTAEVLDQRVFSNLLHDIDVHPVDGRIALGSNDPEPRIRLLDPDDLASPIAEARVEAMYLDHSSDGRRLAAVGGHGALRVLDARTLEVLWSKETIDSRPWSLAFSPNGERIVTSYDSGDFYVWDAASGARLAALEGAQGRAFAAIFSPDGSRILGGDDAGNLHVWDAATYEPLVRIPGHKFYLYSLDFSRDGELLASGSGDFDVRLWDTRSMAERWAGTP